MAISLRCLDRAVNLADVGGFEKRQAESFSRGRLRGLGIGSYLEVTAPPNREMGGIRFETDGNVVSLPARSTMVRAMPLHSPRF